MNIYRMCKAWCDGKRPYLVVRDRDGARDRTWASSQTQCESKRPKWDCTPIVPFTTHTYKDTFGILFIIVMFLLMAMTLISYAGLRPVNDDISNATISSPIPPLPKVVFPDVEIEISWVPADTNLLLQAMENEGQPNGIANHIIKYGTTTNMTNWADVKSDCHGVWCIPETNTVLTVPYSEQYYLEVYSIIQAFESRPRPGFIATNVVINAGSTSNQVERTMYINTNTGVTVVGALGIEVLSYVAMLPASEMIIWTNGSPIIEIPLPPINLNVKTKG